MSSSHSEALDDEELKESDSSPPPPSETINEDDGEDDEEDEAQPAHKVKKFKRMRDKLAEFIDDEAELSGDDVVSEDEADASDDDQYDPQLVDLDAKDLGSDEEEEVRRLYQKQLDTEDRRQILLLQEQLEENEIAVGQRRRKKFHWQTRELMENSLKRHYDPDDDDTQDGPDDDADFEFREIRLRRPTDFGILGSVAKDTSSRVMEIYDDDSESDSDIDASRQLYSKSKVRPVELGPSILGDDEETTSSNTFKNRFANQAARPVSTVNSDMNRFLFRDKEIVEALSTRETTVATRDEKDRAIQRELKRVLQSNSIFDQIYS